MFCVTALYNPPHDSPYTLNGIMFEEVLSKVNKQRNVHMVESNLKTTNWIFCGDLNSTLIYWSSLSSDDQRVSNFLKSIAKFSLGLLTNDDLLRRN